jgi:serine phosphatase RsbU (regulator of sigma subunit)
LKKIELLLEIKVDAAYSYIKQNISDSKKIHYSYGYAKSYINLARYYTLKGQNDSALLVIPTAIKYARSSKDTALIASAYLFHARSLSLASKYQPALEQCLLAQRFVENTKDYKLRVKVLHDLGYVYGNTGLHQQSIGYYQKGLEIAKQKKDTFNIANLSGRIGGEFNYLNRYDSALYYNLEGLKHFKMINHKRGIGAVLVNLATTYSSSKQIDKAIETIKTAIQIRSELGDDYAITILKNNLVESYLDKNEYEQALKTAKEAEVLALRQNEFEPINLNYNLQSIIYSRLKNFEKAYEYAHKCLVIKDSIYQNTNLKAFNELQAKYENDKKEKEISLLQLEKKNTEEKSIAERKQRNITITSISIIALLIALFALMLFRKFTESKKQKQVIEMQKHIVDGKNKEIIDSINYALTIQKAIIPEPSELSKYVKDAFVYFRPKDIVSGDFYWTTKVNGYLFYVVADCTGHGVPGAFMSLMAISYLSEIINEKEILETNEILDTLRHKVISNLNKSEDTEKRDGMDMVILRIDKKNNQLQFSAANNSAYIFRNGTLCELKGNKMPVGLHTGKYNSFTSITEELYENDRIFAFTDGYPDQFGGPKGKKFMYKQLENILCENSAIKLSNLNELLALKFEDWKGTNEQVDDITVFGVEV